MLYRFDGKEPKVAKSAYVSDIARVIGDVVVGENAYIGHGAIIRGDYGRIEIGAGTAIEEGAIIHAPPSNLHKIGDHVTVGHGAILHGKKIDDYAVIGMGAILSLWSEIGRWTIIGEGAVVVMNQVVESEVVAAGNPAKFIRDIRDRDRELWEWGKQLYVDLAKQYIEQGMEPVGQGKP